MATPDKEADNVVPMIPADSNRPVVWDDLQSLRKGLQAYIDVKVDDLKEYCDKRFDKLEGRFDKLEGKVDDVVKKVGGLESKIDDVLDSIRNNK